MAQFEGTWYWTIDGEWLLDGDGNKVKAVGEQGEQGPQGEPGAAGKPGRDGSEPRFEIRKDTETGIDHLWCSVNYGLAWNDCGPISGSSAFQGVEVDTEGDWVVITLTDGTSLKFPTWAAFDRLQQQVSDLNTNAASLKTILEELQKNVYVQSVTPT